MFGFGTSITTLGIKGGVADAADGGASFSLSDLPSIAALYEPYDTSKVFVERTSPATPASIDGVVGTLHDTSVNARHIAAPADGARPLLRAGVAGPYLQPDGINDLMSALFALPQPYTRISLWKQDAWTANDRFLDGGHAVWQVTSSPQIYTRLGAVNATFAPAIGEWFVLTEVANGASSKAKLNNGAFTSLNWPTTPDLTGVTLFALTNNTAHSAVSFGGLVLCSSVLSDEDIAAAVTFLGAKQGLTI